MKHNVHIFQMQHKFIMYPITNLGKSFLISAQLYVLYSGNSGAGEAGSVANVGGGDSGGGLEVV